MLVVDANIVVYLLTVNERTEDARRLWNADKEWWAPRLLAYELANVFTRLVRGKWLALDVAVTGLETGIRLARVPRQEPPAGRILELAARLELSAYDATYLALAERLHVPLVTADARLLSAAPGLARPLGTQSG